MSLWLLSKVVLFLFLYFHCSLPPTSLLHAASYDRMAECFGGRGHKIRRPQELRQIMKLIKDGNVSLPVLINVLISPVSEKTKQVHVIYIQFIESVAMHEDKSF